MGKGTILLALSVQPSLAHFDPLNPPPIKFFLVFILFYWGMKLIEAKC